MRYNPQRLTDDPVITTFLDMASMTTPAGCEPYCWRAIPGPRIIDKYNNLHVIVGDTGGTMFASHLDTADDTPENVWFDFSKRGFVRSNGRTILGADDKAGASIMCHMIRNRVPGWYVFHAGEEIGCLGSSRLALALTDPWGDDVGFELPSPPDRCISFDRRDYDSVVTHQMGERTCSDQFARALSAELGLGHQPDPGGVYTDSNEYRGIIPECTNVSVGYFDQHTNRESQDLEFLRDLADRCLAIDWQSLPTVRDITGHYTERQMTDLELWDPAPGDAYTYEEDFDA